VVDAAPLHATPRADQLFLPALLEPLELLLLPLLFDELPLLLPPLPLFDDELLPRDAVLPLLPPLREVLPPLDDDPPLLLAPLLLFDDELPPLDLEPPDDDPLDFDAVLRDDPPDELPPLDLEAPLDFDDEPPLRELDPLDLLPLFDPLLDEPLLLPPLLVPRDDVLERPRVAALAAAAPSAAPAAAPAAVVSGFLRRLVLRCSFSPRPALNATVVRSGMLISAPVRGLRPERAVRVRLVNLPKPGMDSDPAACTASEMAPPAVSKIASTTRAAAARVSSAFSATMSTKSDLFMGPLSGSAGF